MENSKKKEHPLLEIGNVNVKKFSNNAVYNIHDAFKISNITPIVAV